MLSCLRRVYFQGQSPASHFGCRNLLIQGVSKPPFPVGLLSRFSSTELSSREEDHVATRSLPASYLDQLSQFCADTERVHCVTREELQAREELVERLANHLRISIPDACLSIFGSSYTGLGIGKCDVDVSFQSANFHSDHVKPATAMRRVSRALSSFQDEYSHLRCITHAAIRVPLTKFQVIKSGISVDITYDNLLGVHNSRLLKAYISVDPRFRSLSIMLKILTKACMVTSVRDGTLSSYAYTLMLVYFLQRSDPPVFPSLQELWLKTESGLRGEKDTVLNWDVSHLRDTTLLPELWPSHGLNKRSLGELWLEFLKFYADFDYSKVVAARATSTISCEGHPLASSATSPEGHPMAAPFIIEDPFKLSRNLAGHVTENVREHLQRLFAHSHRHFATPVSGSFQELREFFFTPHYLWGASSPEATPQLCMRCSARNKHFTWECSLPGTAAVAPADQRKVADTDVDAGQQSSSTAGSGAGGVSASSAKQQLYEYAVRTLELPAPVYQFSSTSPGGFKVYDCRVTIGDRIYALPSEARSKSTKAACEKVASIALAALQKDSSSASDAVSGAATIP